MNFPQESTIRYTVPGIRPEFDRFFPIEEDPAFALACDLDGAGLAGGLEGVGNSGETILKSFFLGAPVGVRKGGRWLL